MLFFPDLNAGLEHAEDVLLSDSTHILEEDNNALGLREFEVFTGMPEELLQAYSACIKERDLSAGETLFREKDPGDEIFFVRKGVIHINLQLKSNQHLRLVTIGRGGMFGEMAFIDHQTRSSDATAHKPSHVYVLSRAKFDGLCKIHPAMGAWFFERLASVVASRLRITNNELKVLKEH